MRAGADAAWDADWEEAIAAYQRALVEFPDDVSALTAIGLAQFSAGYVESALESYQRASALAPDDPVLLERIGETLEALGQTEAAASSYSESADRYLSQRGADHVAVQRWQDAIRIYPEHEQSHVRLLRFYQRRGEVRQAVGECLALANIYQGRGQGEYATRICQHALKLAPHDPQVLDALDSLRVGGQAATEDITRGGRTKHRAIADAGRSADVAVPGFPHVSDTGTTEREGSLVGATRLKALTELAESVFEEIDESASSSSTSAPRRLSKAETDALIGQAVDNQTRGRTDAAIATYEQVNEAGAARPAVHFNLGLLFQEKLRFDDAILQFNQAVSDPKYVLGARFALGECYRAKGQIYRAAEQFIEVLKTVDLAAVGRNRSADLIQLYDSLASSSAAKGDPA
jgi:tetratricopeptide (TPR) repeat protein